jgi:hypothetical protein
LNHIAPNEFIRYTRSGRRTLSKVEAGMSQDDEYISVAQARKILGVSGPKMAQLLKSGQLASEPNPVDRRGKILKRSEVEVLAAKVPKRSQPERD